MKLKAIFCLTMCLSLAFAPLANAQFNGFSNQGLVGVGRIPANSFDQLGTNVDTLGGIFSAMAIDPATVQRSGQTYSATLYGLPDRGFGDGAQDYHPRVERFAFSITPYYGTATVLQNQITMTNNSTLLLSYDSNILFTGFDGNDTTSQLFPRSTAASLGQGRRSLDPEGIALRTQDGGYWISDEYGAFVYRFNAAGVLQQTLPLPAGLLPKVGASFPRPNNFNGSSAPTVGRTNNRGLEGLDLTPDGKKLVAMLQSPTVQDSATVGTNNSYNTRILIYDVDPASATNNQLIGEYVYVLTNQANTSGRSTPISELYALNNYQFLILERDNIGLGGTAGAARYKKINLADVSAATNIAGTGYDLEVGAPGALQLPAQNLAGTGITPAARLDFVDMLNPTQLAKFGLNASATQDQNTLAEKWEGLALIPVGETSAPNDFLMLVGNDNDFKASNVYHNGAIVGTNNPTVDNMVLAYRLTLPTSRNTATRKRDFDGDGRTDLAVYRSGSPNGTFFVSNSTNGNFRAQPFGFGTDVVAPGDFDGDDRLEFSVFRNGTFFTQNNVSGEFRANQFGQTDDIPVVADYDGNGKDDFAVFRPSNGTWYFQTPDFNFRTVQFGQAGDIPTLGDFDGDNVSDIAVFRPSNGLWYFQNGNNFRSVQFGVTGDIPVAGDYDGDGKTDLAVYRPSNRVWYYFGTTEGFRAFSIGEDGATPVAGDYDGDGRNDLIVFRNGTWTIRQSSNAATVSLPFGVSGDVPIR